MRRYVRQVRQKGLGNSYAVGRVPQRFQQPLLVASKPFVFVAPLYGVGEPHDVELATSIPVNGGRSDRPVRLRVQVVQLLSDGWELAIDRL